MNGLFFIGGPLLWKGHLIGVTSMSNTDDEFILQVFTYLPFYYDWIERRTGLSMPKCRGTQAFSFPEGKLMEI